jgi:hypothetical protein
MGYGIRKVAKVNLGPAAGARGLDQCAAGQAGSERGWKFDLAEGVVARDGIEPPTPAFSGPRSTTELSGLSANYGLHVYAWIPDGAGEGG